MNFIKIIYTLGLVILFATGYHSSIAQRATTESAKKHYATFLAHKYGPNHMIDRAVLKIYNEFVEYQTNSQVGDFVSSINGITYHQGRITLNFAAKSGESEKLLKELNEIGLEYGAVFKNIVSGLFPIRAIPNLAEIPSLQNAMISRMGFRIGIVDSQGDSSMNTNKVRREFGLDGSGITVGVISDSYNATGGALGGEFLGDLPGIANPNGFNSEIQLLQDPTFGSDEGRAMMEIIHDVSPGASLSFHTAFFGNANFAGGILALADSGAQVIVDDAFYDDSPFFQDGIIAQAVNEVKRQGKVYLSAAGNEGLGSWDVFFKPSGIFDTLVNFEFIDNIVIEDTSIFRFLPDTALFEFHDFGDGNPFKQIKIPPNGFIDWTFQWDQNSVLAGNDNPAAPTELDVLVFNANTQQLVASSSISGQGFVPYDFIAFSNFTEDSIFNFAIVKLDGPNPNRIKFIPFSGTAVDLLRELGGGAIANIRGHVNSEGAIGVGAVPYFQTPAFGLDTAVAEVFSSGGGIPILLDEEGNSIEEIIRDKPEVMGPDGTNTTFFIPGIDVEGDQFFNFFGTSASAPHVAALVALMLEANPSLSPNDVEEILQATALDMDDPTKEGFQLGFDFASGSGYVEGLSAVTAAQVGGVISSFTLINAETNLPVSGFDPMPENAIINIDEIGTRNLTVQVNTIPERVQGSLGIQLTGSGANLKRIENSFPYVLNGDMRGDYNIPSNPPEAGDTFTFAATIFSEKDTMGIKGIPSSITYSFIDSNSPQIEARKAGKKSYSPQIGLYPNPARNEVWVDLTKMLSEKTVEIQIIDMMGRKWFSKIISQANTKQLKIKTKNYIPGIYSLLVSSEDTKINRQFIINR